MLAASPEFIYELYDSGKKKRDKALMSLPRSLDRLTSGAWMDDPDMPEETENPEFEQIAQIGPRVIWDNPRVKVSTVREGPVKDVAKALHHGLNRLIVDTKMSKTFKRLKDDFLLRYCVCFVDFEDVETGLAEVPGIPPGPNGEKLKPRRPKNKRISLRRYGEDPTATCEDEIRFRFIECIEDKSDLLKRAEEHPEQNWNVALIEGGADASQAKTVFRPDGTDGAQKPARNELAYVKFYMKDHQIEGAPGPEDGFNGTWFWLVATGADQSGAVSAEFLRDPEPAYGPPGGCIVVGGEYSVPDDMTPLSSLTAASPILEEQSRHQKALRRAGARRKNIVVADGLSASDADEIKDAIDGDFLIASGFETAKAMQMELGGITEQGMAYKAYVDSKADRLLGRSDATQGNVTGAGTATENQIAFDASSTRTGGTERAFQDFVQEVLWIDAWFLYHDDLVAFPLPKEAQPMMSQVPPGAVPGMEQTTQGPAMVPQDPWFHGGNNRTEQGFTFNDLELMIEPYSMTRTSPQTQAAKGAFLSGPLFDIVERAIANPAIKSEKLFASIGDNFNDPTIEELVDVRMIRIQQGLAMMAMMSPPADPRLGGDVGAQKPQTGATPGRVITPPSGVGRLSLPSAQGRPGAFGGKTGKQAGPGAPQKVGAK